MWSIVIFLLIQQIHLTSQSHIVQATLASTVELPCLATNQSLESISTAKIIWIRDDQADIVSLDSIITVRDARLHIQAKDTLDSQERNLRIGSIEEQDHGLYRCIQGDMILNEILLDVLIPPRIISHSPEYMRVTGREGREARFSCIATGHPTPEILWHVNGLSRPGIVTLVDGKNESMLVLRNLSRLDSGRVDCSASNTLNTVNRQFLLIVKYKPIVTVPFHLRHFRLNDVATITCQVCSIPSTTIFDVFRPKKAVPIMAGVKEKDDENINQTCKQLVIQLFLNESSLFGTYVCRGRNPLGVNHAEFVLKEIIPPPKHIKSVADHRPLSTIKKENRSSKFPKSHSTTTTLTLNQSSRMTISLLLPFITLILVVN